MNLVNKDTARLYPSGTECDDAREVIRSRTATGPQIADACDVLRRSPDKWDREVVSMLEAASSLPGDMADIEAIDRNLSRGLIRPDELLPGWVVWGMIAAVAMACLWVGLAWVDPVGCAVNLSN